MCTYLYYIQEISDQNWEGFKQNSAYFKHYISFFPPLKFVVGDWENKVTCYREVLLQQIMKVLSPFYYVAATNIFFSPLSFLLLPSSHLCVEPRCLTLDCPLSSSFLPPSPVRVELWHPALTCALSSSSLACAWGAPTPGMVASRHDRLMPSSVRWPSARLSPGVDRCGPMVVASWQKKGSW
jgi:hypothetical protein